MDKRIQRLPLECEMIIRKMAFEMGYSKVMSELLGNFDICNGRISGTIPRNVASYLGRNRYGWVNLPEQLPFPLWDVVFD